jgi:hypothetical protein
VRDVQSPRLIKETAGLAEGLLVGVYGSGAEVSRRDGMQEGAQVAGALGRSGSNPLR